MSTLSKWADARASGTWDESKHPRASDGKFGEGSGGPSPHPVSTSAPSAQPASTPRVASPTEFKAAFDSAFKDSEFKNHVTHYTEEQLKEMKLYVTPDGKAGVAIHDHGDGRIEATALFNQGGAKGAGIALLRHAITQGANYVECYGPRLPELYKAVGFKVDSESDFNKEYAAPDWDYAKFPAERTHYFTMKLGGAA